MDFGYTLLAATGVFGFIGYWMDERYGTTPWLLIVGIGLGLAVGFNSLFKRLNRLEGREKATTKQEARQDPDSTP